MTDDELDLELATWLAAGPAAFPADNRRAILRAVHELPRERSRLRGWLAPVRRGVVVAAAAIALIAVGALGLSLWRQLVVAPAASPSPSATPAATAAASHTPAFSSPLYGYSVDLPPNWHVTAATSALARHLRVRERTAQYADEFAFDGDPDAAMSVKAQDLSGRLERVMVGSTIGRPRSNRAATASAPHRPGGK